MYKSFLFRTLGCSLTLLIGSVVFAQTSYPMITHAHPAAVQRGQSEVVTVEGQQDFSAAYQVIFQGDGVVAEIVEPEKLKPNGKKQKRIGKVQIKVRVDAGARPGVRDFRLVTEYGLSSIGQMLIVDCPVAVEQKQNNVPAEAQEINLPIVVCGKIERAEDVDWFKFKAEAGQTLSVETRCARMQDRIHDLQKHADPLVTLRDSNGRELAANDDFYFADSLLTYRIEKAGDYQLQIRDSKYDGDARWVYAMRVTTERYASHLFPLAHPPGYNGPVEAIAPGVENATSANVTVPMDSTEGITCVRPRVEDQVLNPVAVFISKLPQSMEQEPNNAPGAAQPISIPCCMNGRIADRKDLDYYSFSAKKGQSIQFQIMARRFGTELISGLDAGMEILDDKGKVMARGDDISAGNRDASIEFAVKKDGDYVLRVRDLLGKGGSHFIYALKAEYPQPDFRLMCEGDKAMIGPGSSTAWYVKVERLHGFKEPVKIAVEGLPKGVTVNELVVPPTMKEGLLVLTAAGDAPRGAANVRVVGTASVVTPTTQSVEPSVPPQGVGTIGDVLRRIAEPLQEIYNPGGGRRVFGVGLHTVAVTSPSDIARVEVSPESVTLKAGGEVKLTVKVHRREDFKGSVGLDVRLRHLGSVFGDPLPPGVTVDEAKSKTLLGTGSEGHIVLKAAANAAPIENVPICVLSHVSINFMVKMSYTSPVIPVTVQK